jgi:hypothetical protein
MFQTRLSDRGGRHVAGIAAHPNAVTKKLDCGIENVESRMRSIREIFKLIADAPSTRESEVLRAAIDKLPSSYEKSYGNFLAELIDQASLCARVAALFHEGGNSSEEPLISLILERAIAYTRYLGGRETEWGSPNPEAQQRNEALLDLLQARKPGEPFERFTADQQRTVLSMALRVSIAQVHHWMEGLILAEEGFWDS